MRAGPQGEEAMRHRTLSASAVVLACAVLLLPGEEPRDAPARPVGVQGPVVCKDNPRKVERLEITRPGVYENYLVDSNWAGGNWAKMRDLYPQHTPSERR